MRIETALAPRRLSSSRTADIGATASWKMAIRPAEDQPRWIVLMMTLGDNMPTISSAASRASLNRPTAALSGNGPSAPGIKISRLRRNRRQKRPLRLLAAVTLLATAAWLHPDGHQPGQVRRAHGAHCRLWTETGVVVDGEFDRFGTATVTPQPMQRLHPPICTAAMTSPASAAAADHGGDHLQVVRRRAALSSDRGRRARQHLAPRGRITRLLQIGHRYRRQVPTAATVLESHPRQHRPLTRIGTFSAAP